MDYVWIVGIKKLEAADMANPIEVEFSQMKKTQYKHYLMEEVSRLSARIAELTTENIALKQQITSRENG
tara:strand:- start:140 stop:346 length:207 start_codon:yes stop_codon:yes gene_type:complete